MGIPIHNQEFAVERRWTRLHMDKNAPTAAVLIEEVGVYRSDGVWAALETIPHNLSPETLSLVLALPLKGLKLGKEATLGDMLNGLLYGVISGDIPTALTVRPRLVDKESGEELPLQGMMTVLGQGGGAGRVFPLDPAPQITPAPGLQVQFQTGMSFPVVLDVPAVLGEWSPEVVIQRIHPMPPPAPSPVAVPDALPAAHPQEVTDAGRSEPG